MNKLKWGNVIAQVLGVLVLASVKIPALAPFHDVLLATSALLTTGASATHLADSSNAAK